MSKYHDTRIVGYEPLAPPARLHAALPANEAVENTVNVGRATISRMLHGEDSRVLAVVGPCSIHDSAAALEHTS